MFELSVACKYLRPRWRQLSVSIISLISILVIALVVWLIVVFFSVTHGLEKRWVEKLVALTAPIRILPTEAYYHSYYYQIDSISEHSNYTLKTIGEKWRAPQTNPYDFNTDVEIPENWPLPDLEADGSLKDPVKKAYTIINHLPGYPDLKANAFEASMGTLRLKLLRYTEEANPQLSQSFMSQSAFLASLDTENSALQKALIPLTELDINNLLQNLSLQADETEENASPSVTLVHQQVLRERLNTLFNYIKVKELKTPSYGWTVPGNLSSLKEPKRLEGDIFIPATLEADSLNSINNYRRIQFDVAFDQDGQHFAGKIPLGYLQIGKVAIESHFLNQPQSSPFWLYQVGDEKEKRVFLPSDSLLGEGILLPKPFRDAGILLGDSGYISFETPTASSLQEQRIKVFVAGFYDQGLIPIGGRFILVNENIASLIAASQHESHTQSNGINVRFTDFDQAPVIKNQLQKAFIEAGISPYWKIETYREYEFTKDIIQQLSSDKHLFTLISMVIIIVACSNIISMLIILVNDKKLEIGILRSMGASSLSIAFIFGFCGVVMGILGSFIGIGAALLTLKYLDAIVNLLSMIQGHEAFNPVYYGSSLPNEVSGEVLFYVIGATVLISLISGLVPALKASLLRPSTILRAE